MCAREMRFDQTSIDLVFVQPKAGLGDYGMYVLARHQRGEARRRNG